MVDVVREQPLGLVQGHAAGDLWLRVVGSSRTGELIRLSSPKCTIGSSQNCTLRLRVAGVRPVHCLILRGSRGTVIRSCDAGTRLNGLQFLDAALAPGDRLGIGPIELEVLASTEPDTLADVPSTAGTTTAGQPDPTDSLAERRLRERLQLGRDRIRVLVEAVRSLKAELARLQEQFVSEQAERAAQLENDRRQAADDHRDLVARLENERRDWESSRETIQAEIETRSAKLERETAELDAARHALQQQRQQFESDTRDAQHNLEQQSEAHARAQDELARARTEFDRTQSDLTHRQEQFEHERAQALADVDQRRAALEQACQESAARERQEESRLAGNKAELDAAWADLDQQRQQCEAARQRAAVEQDQATAGLAEERGQFDAHRTDLERREAEIADREVASEQRQADLEDRQRETNDELEELERQRIEMRDTLADLEARRAEVDESHAAVSRARTELEQAQAELTDDRREWEQKRGETEAAQAEVDRVRVELDAERARTIEAKASMEQSQLELERSFDDLQRQHEHLTSAQAELSLAEGGTTDCASITATQIVDESTVLAAVIGVQAEKCAWALEQLAWESVQVTAEEQLDRRSVEHVQREQRLDSQAEQQRAFDEQSAQIREQSDALETARQEFGMQCRQEEERLHERAAVLERAANEFEMRREQQNSELNAGAAQHEENVEQLRSRSAESDQRCAALCERESEIEADRREIEVEREKLKKISEQLCQKSTEIEQLRFSLVEVQDAVGEEHAADDESAYRERPVATSCAGVATATDAPPLDREDGFDEAGSLGAESVDLQPGEVEPETGETDASDEEDAANSHESFAAEAAEGEVSIEQYMVALLRRTREGSVQNGAPTKAPARNQRKSDAKRSEALASTGARKPGEVTVLDVSAETLDMVPRAPAEVADLAAMRELANNQARLAIDAHGRKRLIRTALITSSAALGCLVATMLFLALVEPHHTAFRTLAMAGFVGTVFWLFTAGTALQQLYATWHSQQAGLRGNIERADRNKPASPVA